MSIHWPLVFFLLLVGWGCGVYAVSVVTTDWFGKSGQIRMNSMIISFVLLVVGGISSVFHLGRPSRIYLRLVKAHFRNLYRSSPHRIIGFNDHHIYDCR